MEKAKTVRLLLGNSEERLNKIIETLVRGVFAEEAALEVTRQAKVGDFVRNACEEKFDLIILMPEGLKPGYRPQGSPGPTAEAVSAIAAIKQKRTTPIVAFTEQGQDEPALMEAGADQVLAIPFKCDEVKTIVRRMVTMAPPGQQSANGWSFARDLVRGWQRLAQT